MTYRALRLAAGALGFAAVLSACDAGTPISTAGGTVNPPRLDLSVAGLDTVTDRLPFGIPIQVTLRATDDLSLLNVSLLVRRDTVATSGGGLLPVQMSVDTTFKTSTPVYEKTLIMSIDGARSGDRVIVRTTAMDGNGASSYDSLYFVLFDSIPPAVSLLRPARGDTLKSGEPTDTIMISAADSSGLTWISYEVLGVSSGSLVLRDSVVRAVDNRRTTITARFTPDFDTLSPGSYLIRARAMDATGLTTMTDTVRFNIADAIPPVVSYVSPDQGAALLIGDSIDVKAALSDNVALKRYTLVGFSVRGDPRLGATDTVVLYDTVQFNYTSLTTVDTLIRRMRYNGVATTSQDTVVWFRAHLTDLSGNADTAFLRTILVSGPKIIVQADSSAWPNKEVTVSLTVIDSTPGIDRYGYKATLNTGVVLKDTTMFAGGAQYVQSQTIFKVPGDAPIGGSITIVPRATDTGGNTGSGNTVVIPIIAEPSDEAPPTVYQTVPKRMEQGSSLSVDAHDPSTIRAIGYEMRTLPDSVLIASGSIAIASGSRMTNDTATFVVNYERAHRGKLAMVTSWAEDSLGNRGYSIASTSTAPQPDPALAKRDTTLLVYGVTYALPAGSVGADIAVDTNSTRKRVFITDIAQGGMFVWEDSSSTRTVPGFRSTKVSVGSQPWGLAVDTSGNMLFVANSGGTNIDVVDLNTLSDLRGQRVQTPGTSVYDVNWTISATTNVLKYGDLVVKKYSDRPQYLAQSANGNLYFSSRPTDFAPEGTLRRIDDPLGAPRMRQIWQYASAATQKHTFFNGDLVTVYKSLSTTESDKIQVCDTDINTAVQYCSAAHVLAKDAMADLMAQGTFDMELVNDIDLSSLSLPDTNFVSSGTDGRRIAFGEGATGGRPGRVVTVLDTLGTPLNGAVYSTAEQTRDLQNNASDEIYGVAFNSKSNYLAIHGVETYFADTTLRLQGKYATYSTGSGIAFNPGNDSKYAADSVSQAFVASGNSTIEVVDSYYFRLRQSLPLRSNLYGALRTWWTFNPSADVVLKIYGLTPEGLVVIDIRREDLVQK